MEWSNLKVKQREDSSFSCAYLGGNFLVWATTWGLSLEGTNKIFIEIPEEKVYYVTYGEGVKVLSPRTWQVSSLVNSSEGLEGVAYDTLRNKLYWSSPYTIYRCNASDGSNVETVFSPTVCKFPSCLNTSRAIVRYSFVKCLQMDNFLLWPSTGSREISMLPRGVGSSSPVMEPPRGTWLVS